MEATPDPTADPVQLKKALEWELSLDNRDLRSHAWYHGSIPRVRAEEILTENGDFLVRDCASQPGNYVLSCRSKGQGLHFVINKVVIQPDTVYERVQYQFEDDAYDTVPDLITYYVGSGKPITSLSGARISNPRNRLYPLSFYASKYGLQQSCGSGRSSQSVSPLASPLGSTSSSLRLNSYRSPVHSPPRSKREIPPRLPSKKQRSQSLTPSEANGRISLSSIPYRNSIDDRSNSADGVISDNSVVVKCDVENQFSNGGKFSTHSLPRGTGISSTKSQLACPGGATIPRNTKIVRVTSDPALSPCLERRRFGHPSDSQNVDGDTENEIASDRPPPKPSRLPSLLRSASKESSLMAEVNCSVDELSLSGKADITSHPVGNFQRVVSYHASGSDSGNGSGDSVQSSAAGDGSESTTPSSALPPTSRPPSGVIIKNPRYFHQSSSQGIPLSCSSTTLKAFEYDSAIEDSILIESAPNIESNSIFDLENYQTLLLPTLENKPLDATALQGIKIMLQETGSRILANHLTRIDLEVTVGMDSQSAERLCSGDVILGFNSPIEMLSMPIGHQFRLDLIERTRCLKLLVAVTILTCSTENERAEMLNKWIGVAVDTKTALGNLFGFSCIMMGICMPQIQRLTSTWHILRQKFTDGAFNFEAKLRPTLKSMNDCTNPQAPNTTIPHLIPFVLLQERSLDDIVDLNSSDKSTLEAVCLTSWETSTSDFGLTTLFSHLEAARKFGDSVQMFRRNAEIVLGDSKVDDLLLDMFRTEFQLKFLWGSRGATVSPKERHSKFERVLTVMSEKCEPPETAPARSPSPTTSASSSPSRSSSQLHSHNQHVPYNPTIGTSV